MAQPVKPADAGVSIGQVFQGKYRVEAILGAGGMGVVAECTHLALNERVAVKMLRQDVLADHDAVSRFIREAQAAVKLKSEYVARVSDVGTFENGVPYMVMEFLDGHDLGELLKQRGVLPAGWAVELMLQTAEALAEAHSLGIVHRDVKPTNLFVTWRPDGTALIKVLDFGISKSPMGTDMQLTQTQSLLGTPAYMSPEQMRSARLVDSRTDIWSLGTVFYEMLEGRRPFEAESFSEMCVKVAVDPPAQMVNAPPGLQQVIMRCLAKSPEQRYVNMAEFALDLVPYSSDPHGAQMLVERMARMLRRGAVDWDSSGILGKRGAVDWDSTGVGRQAIPTSARELGTGPVRTPLPQQWGLGSDPAGSPWHAKSDPAGRAWHGNTPRGDASQPFGRAYNDGSNSFVMPARDDVSAVGPTLAQHKRSKLPWMLVALALLTAGAIAAALTFRRTEEQAPPTPESATQQPTPDDVKYQERVPDTTDSKAAGTPDTVEVKTTTRTTKTSGKSSKTGTKTAKTDTKAAKAGSAAPAVETTDVKKEPEKKVPCDPFDSMHGCK